MCIGPNSSSSSGKCGQIPTGFVGLPRVGQCVSLFGHEFGQGSNIVWSVTSLRLSVPDSDCLSSVVFIK